MLLCFPIIYKVASCCVAVWTDTVLKD